ncbi:MAG TPA: response regulator transcription factor [Pyrinomonadaceae bacterium]|nr:response regulator transcription factor [Pyrinomonadaceae bacterium]
MKKILIVEDDKDIIELVRYNFEKENFRVIHAEDGVLGLTQIRKTHPDLIILDLMLPRLSGLEICREVRKDPTLSRIPIIMLTARGDEADRVVGLEMGADDYVPKPFSPRELVARVRALFRRGEPSETESNESPVEIGNLVIDPHRFQVLKDGSALSLSSLEFRLLHFLASHPNRVYSRDRLLDAIWGNERYVIPRSIDVYIRRLREKIENDPQQPVFLKTVRGAGYLFESQYSGR